MQELFQAWIGAVLFVMVGILLLGRAHLSLTVRRIERKVDALANHAGLDFGEVATREARSLVTAGQKIEAVMLYRDLTGTSLEDAKAVVDRFGR